ncbi:hypothetical protein JCM19379_22900 [Methyloparacoccus murrellii]
MASEPIDRLLNRLDRVKPTGPGTWLASCPTAAHQHGDRSRGLSIREGDDRRVLVHCFSGCSAAEVVGALGLELADLFPDRAITYPHQSPRGGLIGRGRVPRVPWRDFFEGIEHDLRACSLAFGDLAAGVVFSPADATSIAKLASHLADEIAEVRHAGH